MEQKRGLDFSEASWDIMPLVLDWMEGLPELRALALSINCDPQKEPQNAEEAARFRSSHAALSWLTALGAGLEQLIAAAWSRDKEDNMVEDETEIKVHY